MKRAKLKKRYHANTNERHTKAHRRSPTLMSSSNGQYREGGTQILTETDRERQRERERERERERAGERERERERERDVYVVHVLNKFGPDFRFFPRKAYRMQAC